MQIKEILERCALSQGFLQPFICRAEDEQLYFIKGSNSTVLGLVREWIASKLAIAFGLPVPDSLLLYLDPELKAVIDDPFWLRDLDFENVFASKSVAPCETLTLSNVSNIPLKLQRDIFVFDLWVRNSDRNLGPNGGNVNLLIQSSTQLLQVIDFNLAFDDKFSIDQMSNHVFRSSVKAYPIDLADKAEYLARMKSAERDLNVWIEQIPEEWLEHSAAAEPLIDFITEILREGSSDAFWGDLI
ncbi:hypothetical protein SAMN02745127_00683 [Oceanospirillum multiglobuliferum]|uniref:HipA-like kinase domain-containing protein n=1 Tax=Oceanospirillum multiglobuliferum TaxID=64969 RepID=A0A1T4M6N5_9GAMM|nr:HipA family kinase [Oceanospirillum multiglobuliferum]OPX56224.1 hypothetical protein BTE48_04405 [Oceanospirillum multiglobuliferum]SJZ62680.1 hypothetical protein SAMN02745127_00683 [Oceanospirillum multiglobuliferum]